eukprot:scaffold20733_cov124-Skeletonema_marinoi.AAC.1
MRLLGAVRVKLALNTLKASSHRGSSCVCVGGERPNKNLSITSYIESQRSLHRRQDRSPHSGLHALLLPRLLILGTMVTRTVILVTPSEAAAFAATTNSSAAAAVAATSLSTPAAAAESVVINNAPAEQNSTELQTKICNYPSCSKPAQHTSPGGLVQLCRHKE